MTTDQICELCRTFPHAIEELKWDNDLVFTIGGKMFAVVGLAEEEFAGVAFKCDDGDFERLAEVKGIVPAPYLARAKWVQVQEEEALPAGELTAQLRKSYEIVKSKLPKSRQAELTGSMA
ncbi:MAG TPA: MmcQ/YjbR family DNA-binding protein [Fimbriimonadaceae bacterium]|nr:MmcQ/YjbR family DNA-binding protein [Fimbriimonadaceae bacterium]